MPFNGHRCPAVKLQTENVSKSPPPGEPSDPTSKFDAPLVDTDPALAWERGRLMCWNSQGLPGLAGGTFSGSRGVTDGGPGESLRIGPERLILSESAFGTPRRLTQNEHSGARVRRTTN
jgi:hypothetical protein